MFSVVATAEALEEGCRLPCPCANFLSFSAARQSMDKTVGLSVSSLVCGLC
jgi:hypothetical protein